MNKIQIHTIKNTLEETLYLQTDDNNELILAPGEELQEVDNVHLNLLENLADLEQEDVKIIRVGPDQLTYAYAASMDRGLVSAAGINPEDFFPQDPTHLKITEFVPFPGQRISVFFKTDDLSTGQRVTWVIGEIDPRV